MQDESAVRILVCVNERFDPRKPSCKARGSGDLVRALTEAVAGRKSPVSVHSIMCFGRCDLGVNVRVAPGGEFFHGASVDDVDTIIAAAERIVSAAT